MDYTIRVTKQQYTYTPLVLRMMGINHSQEKVNRPSGLPTWQILYGVSGRGNVRIEESRYILQEGQIAVLPPHTGHQYESAQREWIVHFLGFDGNACQKLLTDLGLAQPGVYHLSQGENTGKVFLLHLEEFERVVRSQMQLKYRALSKELYSTLLDLAAGSSLERTALWNDPDGLMSDVIEYLEHHCSEDISLMQIGEEFHLTPEYLCARFKNSTGETVGQYLKRVRIGRARILLMERPDLNLKEIGERCGYRSPSYFGKVFREMTGMTPQSFRTVR